MKSSFSGSAFSAPLRGKRGERIEPTACFEAAEEFACPTTQGIVWLDAASSGYQPGGRATGSSVPTRRSPAGLVFLCEAQMQSALVGRLAVAAAGSDSCEPFFRYQVRARELKAAAWTGPSSYPWMPRTPEPGRRRRSWPVRHLHAPSTNCARSCKKTGLSAPRFSRFVASFIVAPWRSGPKCGSQVIYPIRRRRRTMCFPLRTLLWDVHAKRHRNRRAGNLRSDIS